MEFHNFINFCSMHSGYNCVLLIFQIIVGESRGDPNKRHCLLKAATDHQSVFVTHCPQSSCHHYVSPCVAPPPLLAVVLLCFFINSSGSICK